MPLFFRSTSKNRHKGAVEGVVGYEGRRDMPKPFDIHEAEHGKRSNAERLFKGEAYRPYRLRYK
jgi:hypothetical protein